MRLLSICLLTLVVLSCLNVSFIYAKTIEFATFEQPPVIYNQKGQLKGIAVEIVKAVFKEMEQPVQFTSYPFSRSLKMVRENQADAIFAIVKNKSREEEFIFSQQVLLNQDAVLLVNYDSDIQYNGNLVNLRHYRFATLRSATYGSQWQNAITNNALPRVIELTTYRQSLLMLEKNRVDIVIGSHITLAQEIKNLNAQHKYKVLYPPLESVPTYMAFSKTKQNYQLKEKFDQILKQFKQDGRYQQIVQAYLGADYPSSN